MTQAFARRLLTTPDGKRIIAVEVDHAGTVKRLQAPLSLFPAMP